MDSIHHNKFYVVLPIDFSSCLQFYQTLHLDFCFAKTFVNSQRAEWERVWPGYPWSWLRQARGKANDLITFNYKSEGMKNWLYIIYYVISFANE